MNIQRLLLSHLLAMDERVASVRERKGVQGVTGINLCYLTLLRLIIHHANLPTQARLQLPFLIAYLLSKHKTDPFPVPWREVNG